MASIFGDDDGLINLDEVTGAAKHQEDNIFQPWHKPRKQFVRCNQWWKHIEFLLSRYKEYNQIETIKYFGLPGSDLLDISYFSQKLLTSNHSEKKLFVHGFIDSAQGKEKADLRLSALLDRKNVDANSKVEHFNFQALAEKKSLALGRIKNAGAYHLINLDFCDGVFQKRTINSMMTLLTYQFNTMAGMPWLLFLTTRADKEGIAKDLLEDLDRIFCASLRGDDAFIAALEIHRKNIHAMLEEKKSLKDEEISESELSEIFQVCFIFWLVKFSHENEARLEVVSTMKYRIHEGNDYPDMFSYVMRITRSTTIKKDTLGLGEATGLIAAELTDATKEKDKARAVGILYEALNVDTHLSSNPDEMRIYAEDMKTLLREAGWNIENYEVQMGI